MKTVSRNRPLASARLWLVVTAASVSALVARPAGAEEPWPPSTPPRVDSLTETTEPLPPPQPVAPPPAAPPPAAPPPAAAAAPAAPPVEQESAPSRATETASDDTTLVRRAPEPQSPGLSYVYGSKDGQFYVRSLGDELTLLPSVRLELGGNSTSAGATSKSSRGVGLARVDVAGWLYSKAYFDLSVDFASGPSLRHVDNFVAIAPWRDQVIFQVGQFDAPFTLENRTSDRYLDFIDRGVAIRSFAIPENKDQGLMVHGTNDARNYYYSAAVLTGEGPTITSVDGQFDVMARAWIAPLSFRGPEVISGVTLGASGWTGDRVIGPYYQGLTTSSGFSVVDASAWWHSASPSSLVVRERGRLYAGALELNAPIAHRFGARAEWIAKKQPLSAMDPTDPTHMIAGGINLSGWAMYAEVWGWILGDDRMFGPAAAPGLELPARFHDFTGTAPKHALMVAARLDYVDQQSALTSYSKMAGLDAGSTGDTKLTSMTLGATYWYTRRARLTLNYAFNQFSGTTPYLRGLGFNSEQELLFQTAFAL
jgi:hypothetical protein